jgi:type III restriction enzyme
VNRNVNAIAGRLSLRPPQRHSLEILDRITEIAPPTKEVDAAAALAAIRSEYPSVTDFEREFPSLCFALATGVGKTRLMGAFISYLHQAHGFNNFFVLAPNLTIYNKLITDFTPNTPKYVFTGIAEFATEPPAIITGENYEAQAGMLFDELLRCKINIFNISKINSEVRGGKSPRIKRLSEYIGQSYFEYLAALPDLVLIMDESHRYRATAGVRAINELRPILGLELTATPFVESSRGPVPFKNVILDYPLGQAMADCFVKEPAVVTRKDFDPAGMEPAEVERLKLEDGIRLHESVKVQLETYARETGNQVVKPFLLVIARDTTHAAELLALIQSNEFFEGRYKDHVIQVDSSQTGAAEEAMIERLLKVEHAEEPTEIVIHVNMLKEGWDVTNLYTIVPLRAANARTLIEQSIGRGLRLPYGKRTGVTAVDRLNIVAHDRFQEIVDEANRADSVIRLQAVVMDSADLDRRTVTIVAQSNLAAALGVAPEAGAPPPARGPKVTPAFGQPEELALGQLAAEIVLSLGGDPNRAPTFEYFRRPEVQAAIAAKVKERAATPQLTIEALGEPVDVERIVARTVELIEQRTIPIPTIIVVPKGDVRTGFKPFELDVRAFRFPPVSDELFAQHLRTGATETLILGHENRDDARPEDAIVQALADFDDVAYDTHAALLYDLAGRAVAHLRSYLSDEDAGKVSWVHQREIARNIHAQLQAQAFEEAAGYEVRVMRSFSPLKASAFTAAAGEPVLSFREAPKDKTNMPRYLFGGFERCLFHPVRFQSDTERVLSVILDRDALRWFRPARGQFGISYRQGAAQAEYQPDFVAETADSIWMLESKAKNEMDDPKVASKRDAAVVWCAHASDWTTAQGGKPWRYGLIPHDAIAENMSLATLATRFEQPPPAERP